MNIANISGPSIFPWGTLESTGNIMESSFLQTTHTPKCVVKVSLKPTPEITSNTMHLPEFAMGD